MKTYFGFNGGVLSYNSDTKRVSRYVCNEREVAWIKERDATDGDLIGAYQISREAFLEGIDKMIAELEKIKKSREALR